jgi:hypothetical protein
MSVALLPLHHNLALKLSLQLTSTECDFSQAPNARTVQVLPLSQPPSPRRQGHVAADHAHVQGVDACT